MGVLVITRSPKSKKNIFETLRQVDHLIVLAEEPVAATYYGHPEVYAIASLGTEDIWDAIEHHDLGGKFSRVLSSREDLVIPAAVIRSRLGIPGQSVESAIAFRNKARMKAFVATAETFRVPRFFAPGLPSTAASPKDIKGPAVKKPIDGAGAADVVVYDDPVEAGDLAPNEMIEEFVDLPMLHADGIVARGELQFFCVSKYINFCTSFYKNEIFGSQICADCSLNERVKLAIEEIMALLPCPYSFVFHLEMFFSESDLVFCEIACRPGGAFINRCVEISYNIDLSQQGMLAQAGCFVYFACHLRCISAFLSVPYGINIQVDPARLRSYPWLREYVVGMEKKEKSETCVDSQFMALITGCTPQEVEANIRVLQEEILAKPEGLIAGSDKLRDRPDFRAFA